MIAANWCVRRLELHNTRESSSESTREWQTTHDERGHQSTRMHTARCLFRHRAVRLWVSWGQNRPLAEVCLNRLPQRTFSGGSDMESLQQHGLIISHLHPQASRSKQKQDRVDTGNKELVLEPACERLSFDPDFDDAPAGHGAAMSHPSFQHCRVGKRKKQHFSTHSSFPLSHSTVSFQA